MSEAAVKCAQSEYEQDVADDGSGNRCLDQVMESGAQGNNRDDELSGVAERRVQQTTNSFAQRFRELLGSPAHQTSERNDGQRGSDEDRHAAGMHEILERKRNGYEYQQQIQQIGAQPLSFGKRHQGKG